MKSIELFKFTRDSLSWHKTSGAAAVLFNTDTYTLAAIKRSEIQQNNEISKANVNITLPLQDDLVQNYLAGVPNKILSLTIFKDSISGFKTMWKGRLVSHEIADTSMVFRFESIFTSMRRPGLRARFQYQCRHTVYGPGCNLDPLDFEEDGVATALNGLTLTVTGADAFPDGYFRGGMLGQPDGSKLFIRAHVGTSITLNWPPTNTYEEIVNTPGGANVKLYPGCDLSPEVCDGTFDNILNNGGFRWLPTRNPFNGSSII